MRIPLLSERAGTGIVFRLSGVRQQTEARNQTCSDMIWFQVQVRTYWWGSFVPKMICASTASDALIQHHTVATFCDRCLEKREIMQHIRDHES